MPEGYLDVIKSITDGAFPVAGGTIVIYGTADFRIFIRFCRCQSVCEEPNGSLNVVLSC